MTYEDQGGVSYTPAQELSNVVTNIISSNPDIDQSTINDLYGVVRDGGDAIRDGQSTFAEALGGLVAIAEQAPDISYIPSLPEEPVWNPSLYGTTASGVTVEEPSFAGEAPTGATALSLAAQVSDTVMAILVSRPNMDAIDAFELARSSQALAQDVQAGRISYSIAKGVLAYLAAQAKDVVTVVGVTPVNPGINSTTDAIALHVVITPPHVGSGGLLPASTAAEQGPDGRTFDQITGRDYASDSERTWYLAQIALRNSPSSPNGRTFAQITGTDYLSAEERIWYLNQMGKTVDQANAIVNVISKPIAVITSVPTPSGGHYVYPMSDLQQSAAASAQKYGVPPQLLINLIEHEGGFNPTKLDPTSGAFSGILPSTAASYGTTIGALVADPPKAYEIAADYISKNLKYFGGDVAKAFASYYVGAGTVNDAVKTGGANWLSAADYIAVNVYKQTYSPTPVTTYLRSIGVI